MVSYKALNTTIEMEKILSKVLGSDWKDYLYEYKRNLGKRYEPGQ